MRVIGIIAEFNPFHNGHEYLISKAREVVNDNRAIVMTVMSGPFVQRGTPSVFPKHVRAKEALLCGSDVVLEIPFTFACAPSERFATGAVELLYRTGVVTDLVFGIDCSNPDVLKTLATIEPDQEVLKENLASGKSYPASRAEAIISSYMKSHPELSKDDETELRDTLHKPNSILAIDYLRALKITGAKFKVHMIPRTPDASATDTRKRLFDGDMDIASVADRLNGFLPDKSLAVALSGISNKTFSLPQKDKLANDLCDKILIGINDNIAYMGDGLSGYISNTFENTRDYSYDALMDKLCTKHFTMPRIRRALASLLINQSEEYIESEKHVQYIRILGFSKNGRYCLKIMSKCARLPIIHNCSDALELYSTNERLKKQFELDLRANNLQGKYLNMKRDYEWELAPIMVK